MNELNNNLNIKQDDMLNKGSEIDMNNSQNYNHTNNEELINAYIGKGVEKIRKGKFSLWTCFFGTAYVFYRKMWLLGLVWYLINIFIALTAAFITLKVFNIVELLQSSTYSITTIVVFVSSCIVNIIISFLFKKLYIKKSEKKVEKIKQKNSNKTNEELKKICAKKGGTTIIGIVVAILLSGVVETICEPIVEKIVSNEIHNKLAKETAYSIISEVEYAYTQAFLTSGKDTLILEDIKKEYNGLSSTWNKDNTITSKHYDVVCNVTVNNDNKIQVSCDVLGEKIESELLDLNIGNKGNNQANNNQNNGNSNNIDILKENGKNNILSSNNDCINNNTKCENGTVVNVKVNEKQEYRFYVINDTGMHLTLIMDGNLGGNVSWFDEGQEEIKTTSSGPITAIEVLKERTNEWTNIPKKDYTYSDDGGSSKYSMFSENMRVRMLTVTEGKSLGCDYKLNSCPKYLYSAENGYWTSSATSASDNIGEAIYVTNEGGLSQLLVNYPTICGIRPVIEITKQENDTVENNSQNTSNLLTESEALELGKDLYEYANNVASDKEFEYIHNQPDGSLILNYEEVTSKFTQKYISSTGNIFSTIKKGDDGKYYDSSVRGFGVSCAKVSLTDLNVTNISNNYITFDAIATTTSTSKECGGLEVGTVVRTDKQTFGIKKENNIWKIDVYEFQYVTE